MARAAPTSPAELRLPPDPCADTTESGCLAMAARARRHRFSGACGRAGGLGDVPSDPNRTRRHAVDARRHLWVARHDLTVHGDPARCQDVGRRYRRILRISQNSIADLPDDMRQVEWHRSADLDDLSDRAVVELAHPDVSRRASEVPAGPGRDPQRKDIRARSARRDRSSVSPGRSRRCSPPRSRRTSTREPRAWWPRRALRRPPRSRRVTDSRDRARRRRRPPREG